MLDQSAESINGSVNVDILTPKQANDHNPQTRDTTQARSMEAPKTPVDADRPEPRNATGTQPSEQEPKLEPGDNNAGNATPSSLDTSPGQDGKLPEEPSGGTARKSRFRCINKRHEVKVERRSWLYPSVLFEGFTILAGAPESGKSFLALNILLSLAKLKPDDSFVYLALDDDHRRFVPRLDDLLAGEQELSNVHYITASDNWPRMNKNTGGGDCLQELIAGLKALPNPRLAVIDTLAQFLPVPPTDKGFAYQHEYAMLAEIRKLTSVFPGLTVLVITHTNKGDHKDLF